VQHRTTRSHDVETLAFLLVLFALIFVVTLTVGSHIV
jgi:hypothetical protein